MKKVNFNALQNFEVPDSWIENALNAKPKKKPFYLNARYIGSAAGFVLAVGISLFSLLYLNHDFTPPTSPKVTETTISSSSAKQKNTVSVTNSGIAVTELSETTKVVQATEKKEPTEQTEQNEITDQTDIPEDITPVSDNNHSEEHKETEPYEQPETPEKPEETVKPQKPTNTVEEPKSTERVNDTSDKSDEEQYTAFPLKTLDITTNWERTLKYSSGSHSGDSSGDDTNEDKKNTIECSEELFTNDIEILVPQTIWDKKCKKIECSISGVDENTKEINGKLSFIFLNNTQKENLLINLSQKSIDIPCGKYDINFTYYSSHYKNGYQLISELPTTQFLEQSLYNNDKIVLQLF